jgi:hypothetical protein
MKFWLEKKNILFAPVFDNPLFMLGTGIGNRVDTSRLGSQTVGIEVYTRHKKELLSLTFNDLIINKTVVNYQQFLDRLTFNVNFNTYMTIRRAIFFAIKKYEKKLDCLAVPVHIFEFLAKDVKGSKRFRKFLDSSSSIANAGTNTIQTLSNLINIDIPDPVVVTRLRGYWNSSHLNVELKNFALNLFRNSLPVRARLYNRYNDAQLDQSCNLCRLDSNVNGPAHRETFCHLFWDCEYSTKIYEKFCEKYDIVNDPTTLKQRLFFGIKNGKFNNVIMLQSLLLLHEIWRARNRNKRLSFVTVDRNMLWEYTAIAKTCRVILHEAEIVNENWFRSWRAGYQYGRG